MAAATYMWLLSTLNVVIVPKEVNFEFCLILNKVSKLHMASGCHIGQHNSRFSGHLSETNRKIFTNLKKQPPEF